MRMRACGAWVGYSVLLAFAAVVLGVFLARQASEQYNTDAQFLAQALRQVMVRPHTAHSLLGRDCLLPLKSFFMWGCAVGHAKRSPWGDGVAGSFAAPMLRCATRGKPPLRSAYIRSLAALSASFSTTIGAG